MSDFSSLLELKCEEIYELAGEGPIGLISEKFFMEHVLPLFPNSGETRACMNDDFLVTPFSCPCCMNSVVALGSIEPICYGASVPIDEITVDTIVSERTADEYRFFCIREYSCGATFRYEHTWS